ncbi:MAG: NUDIX domain-containing protein [Acidimicrobiales bacterium]
MTSTDPPPEDALFDIPRIPASAGALIFDPSGLLLVLKPTYKDGWTVPGGQMEANGESPWEACQREVQEETGLIVDTGRLVCVDFLRPRPGKPGGMRFLFDCGALSGDTLSAIDLQEEELSEYRLADMDHAIELLSGPLRRRVRSAIGAVGALYLEDGRPVDT